LTNTDENNIIKEPKGSTSEYSVDWSVINTKGYQDKIIDLTDKKVVGKAVYKVAKTILEHRQGTPKEDLYLIDARAGEIVYKIDDSDKDKHVRGTSELLALLSKKDGKDLIMVQNHPQNLPPSNTDLNTLYKNPKIKYGIILGHKGEIYKYTAPKKEIADFEISVAKAKFKKLGYTDKEIDEIVYKILSKKFDFKLEVVKNG
jgi:proteasome lid subunit RPN8/RPN11